MRAALLLIALTGCLERRPDVFDGVDDDAVCSWDIVHEERGQCISGGQHFRCIRRYEKSDTGYWYRTSCVQLKLGGLL